jgi:hypothetical protein
MSGESVQQALIQGRCEDIYYSNPEVTKKECIRTKINTKYVQAFNSLSGGTNTFLIPPNYGLQHVVVELTLPSATNTTGVSLASGWGYSLIKQISYRIGGSTQFFVSGQQMLQHAIKRMTSVAAANDLITLGGAAIAGTGLASTSNIAYCFIDLPFNKATSEGLPCPLPSDLLGSQVQVTVELYPLSQIVIASYGATSPYTGSLASAQFQVQQVVMESRDDSLASRENMSTHQYVYPIEFVQQEQLIGPSSYTAGTLNTVTATGFRSGSVKSIEMWLTSGAEALSVQTVGTTGNAIGAPLLWYAPRNVQVTYAGDVYFRADDGSSVLWNLINAKHSPQFTYSYFTGNSGSTALTAATATSQYVTCPFAATFDAPETSTFVLVEGLNVTNGIVNIQFSAPSTKTDWTLHLSYIYNASCVFSQSSCEVVF